jgi:hypothetical protein
MLNMILSMLLFINSPVNKHMHNSTQQIKGIVISADTKEPVTNAYLYIIKGEEEALTNAKGEFTITTSEKTPLMLTVIHKDFKELKVKMNAGSQPLKIILQRK